MQEKQQMSTADVRVSEQNKLYQGYFAMLQYKLQHRLYSGEWGPTLTRELFERGNSVGALLFDPNLNKIVLVEQFRLGALADEQSPWLLEIIAGANDKNEVSQAVAIRETKEEANLDVTDIIPIAEYWVSPGGSSERMNLFCAKVDAAHAGGVHGLASEAEDIKVIVMSLEGAWHALDNNMIRNGASIIALQWLRLHYDEVVNNWKD